MANDVLARDYWILNSWGVATNSANTGTVSYFAGSQNINILVQAVITNLLPNTAYHFSIMASNSVGVSNSAPFVFSTASFPPVVYSNLVPIVSGNTAVVTGMVNPNGEPTTVVFDYVRKTEGLSKTLTRL
jgi:hypothetical protein